MAQVLQPHTHIKRAIQVGPRQYWRAIVKIGLLNKIAGQEESFIEWHATECAAPRNDCHGCAPVELALESL